MDVTNQVGPAVAAAPVELLAESDCGLELGGGTHGDGGGVGEASESANLVGESRLVRQPGQQLLAGGKGQAG
ncbi:hypothetical protein [Micromonospora sp. A200]|uniref:hypothetical protein n=1 Tax=Micromonospora sp. A200 TaxID=2940568 RepID=UPI002475CEBD|nr:hypothetical protein [Micromonospora sp. A200]